MKIPTSLEAGYRCVPLTATESASCLRYCVVVRELADPVAGHYVILRQTPEARVLLGAVCDAALVVHEWVEIWLQHVESTDDDASIAGSNAARDEAWAEFIKSLRLASPADCFFTKQEHEPPRPTFLRTDIWEPWHPLGKSESLHLCRDDAALEAAGLPPYTVSAARFAQGGDEFFALNRAATDTHAERSHPVPFPKDIPFIPLNHAAGLFFIRRFSPLSVEEFAELLGGRPWSGLANASRPMALNGIYRCLAGEADMRAGGRHFHGSRRDLAARAVETLCLKLLLLEQCVQAVADESRHTAAPLLNLSADSFRVSLGATGVNMPFFWTAKTTLVLPGEAQSLNLPTSRTRHFATRSLPTASIYRPEELGVPRRGRGHVRLRRIFSPADGGIVAEGTLTTQERLPVSANDLLRLRLPLKDFGLLELYGTLDTAATLAPGEAAFRTIPLHLDDDRTAVLQSYEGIPFSQIPFEVLPPLSSPCDLYSLGVLGLRILFAGSEITLPTLLDATLSLARALGAQGGSHMALEKRLEDLFETDPRWCAVLGPQHVLRAQENTADSAPHIPLALWGTVLGALIPFFPGCGSFSLCRDLADAPALAPHTIFERALQSVQRAQLHTHSVFLGDWRQNAEVLALIECRTL